MTYEEEKFGSRNRDSRPSDTGLREHSDPMDVDAVNSLSLSSSEGKGSSGPRDGYFLVRWSTFFNETALQARIPANNRLAKATRASHGPRVSPVSQAKE